MNEITQRVVDSFIEKYSSEPDIIASAPGRVNVIGEHTDYNGGFVLPVAIDREIVIAAKKVPEKIVTGFSIDFNEEASFHVGKYDQKHPCVWLRYVMGVLYELAKIDVSIEGFHFTVGGNIPIGSGLSSSAALEMAVYTAMEGLLDFQSDDMQAALLCQRAENNFVGMNCGIMDQYISRIGKKDHAILIDCRDLSTRAIKMSTPGCSWLVIDSKKQRGLVDSEYNKRRSECEEGVKAAQSVFPERYFESLRDIAPDDLDELKTFCDENVFKRVKHNVTENNRVLNTVDALEAGDIDTVGKNLYASHESLRDDFQVSCEELDMLIGILSKVDGVIGARLTGAGFGGCVIALVRDEAIGNAKSAINEKYRPKSLPDDIYADIWPIKISSGARLIDKNQE